MTATLVRFYGFARAGGSPRLRVSTYARPAPGASLSRAPDARQLPRLRAPLACRWQADPVTRVLTARWDGPPADAGTAAADGLQGEGPKQSFHRLRQAARGEAARSRAAARLAA
jgi:hypothetical protein